MQHTRRVEEPSDKPPTNTDYRNNQADSDYRVVIPGGAVLPCDLLQLLFEAGVVEAEFDMDRLEVLSSNVSEKFRLAPLSRQRAACLVACEIAIETSKMEDPLVRDALRQLRTGKSLTPESRAQINLQAARLDEKYLDMQDAVEKREATTADCLHLFAKSRAMAALSFAADNSPDALREAIYEAAAAVGDDKNRFLFLIESALE